jgi:type I restriction enzyme S subunit
VDDLKPGWRRVKFGDVVRLSRASCKDPSAEGIDRYVGLEHLDPGDLRVRSWGEVSKGTTFTNRVRPGQVLFGKRRAYQRKVAVADFDAVCSGDIYVFESADPGKLLPDLLPFVCQTDAFFDYAVGTSAGSLSPRTNWTSLAEYEVTLPPVGEQQRFVQAMRAWQSAIDAFRETEVAGSRLFQSLCASLLLPSGSGGSARPKARRDSALDWKEYTIEQICLRDRGLAIGPNGENLTRADYQGREKGVPIIFMRDINPNRFAYVSKTYLSEEKAARFGIHEAVTNDIVITKMGHPEGVSVPPGVAAVIPESMPRSIITADVLRLRLDPSLASHDFVAFLLNSQWGRAQTWRLSPSGAGRHKMRLAELAKLRLSLPSLAAQLEAVTSLRQQRHALDALNGRLRVCARAQRTSLAHWWQQ